MSPLQVEVWSDIACPWCHVGKRRLEEALERFAARHPDGPPVQVRWRAFELDTEAPRRADPEVSYAERLARKYATSTERAQQMIDGMTATAAGEGLDFHFERIRPGNTFDAHRLLHLAAGRGLEGALKERFLRGYLTEGEPIGDPEALARMAVEAGLDEAEVRAVLAGDEHAEAVRADEARARARGIQGVPHFLVGGRHPASGAQPPEVLLALLEKGRAELAEGADAETTPAGGVCGPDGCD
jgi:predicted DsbA family dithiol-disulfide isomerase